MRARTGRCRYAESDGTEDVEGSDTWYQNDVFYGTPFARGFGVAAVSWGMAGGDATHTIRTSFVGAGGAAFVVTSSGGDYQLVPEPGTLSLLGAGLATLAAVRGRGSRVRREARDGARSISRVGARMH